MPIFIAICQLEFYKVHNLNDFKKENMFLKTHFNKVFKIISLTCTQIDANTFDHIEIFCKHLKTIVDAKIGHFEQN